MYVILCPGQGAQYLGMGEALARHSSVVRETFEEVESYAQVPIRQWCWEDAAALKTTYGAQLATLTCSLAIARLLRTHVAVEGVAGLSLGEITAHILAQTLSVADGITLVQKRAAAMQTCCEAERSGLWAVLGASEAEVAAALQDTGLWIANYNMPKQHVIGGLHNDFTRAQLCLKTIPLQVAGAFHTPLMTPAATLLDTVTPSLKIEKPTIPLYSSITGACAYGGEQWSQLLAQQPARPVRWAPLLPLLQSKRCIEVGPGSVLTKMVLRSGGSATSINTQEDWEKFIEGSACNYKD